MDPLTVFVIGALMMLANGAVLGLLHRDLPPSLQPAAASWRIATLLIAGGCIVFAVHAYLSPLFVLPLANFMVFLGFTGYWRALRQFYHRDENWWIFLPSFLGVLGVIWFLRFREDIGARIVIVSLVWVFITINCIHVLMSGRKHQTALSRRVLAGIFVIIIIFSIIRVIYFVALDGSPGQSLLDRTSWLNVLTPLVAAILPVIGTTAFLLMCSERLRRQWEHAASTDYLTGLPNRRTLANVGERRVNEFQQQGKGVALAVIDVDHFKSLNDRFGHDIGDLALKHVAQQLASACRASELAARQGGEEFVVLFDGLNEEQARMVGERMREAVEAHPFSNGQQTLVITVSIGVAIMQQQDSSFDALMSRADVALYSAKSNGRNRVELAL